MSELFSFDDFDLEVSGEPPAKTTVEPLEEWAEQQLSERGPLFFDIETGPRPEQELKRIYREKTLEEFSATCDKRWKAETVKEKYAEYAASAWQEFVGKAALSATTGRVLLIGLLSGNTFTALGDESEAKNLHRFWNTIEGAISSKSRIIGHNSNSFDLPFLVRRSWSLGVPVPREIRQGRYWNPLFVDTMEAWSFGGREYASLDSIGVFFGVGQKTEGVCGADFAKLWFGTPADRQKALDYNEQDLRLTAAIAAKMGLV